jgi:DNA-binding transcriptional LysR family regulator
MSGEIDLAVGVFSELPPSIVGRKIFQDTLVCIADRNNKHLRKDRMSFEDYLLCPHLTVAFDRQSGFQLDDILSRQGIKRHIAVVLPHYLIIPLAIRGTDLVGHVRKQFSTGFGQFPGLVVFDLPAPIEAPELSFQQIWHTRRDNDLGHTWLREFLESRIHQ